MDLAFFLLAFYSPCSSIQVAEFPNLQVSKCSIICLLGYSAAWLLHLKYIPFFFTAELPVDFGNLLAPSLPLAMLHFHHFIVWPVEVIGNKGYLLMESVKGVAYNSPNGSASNSNWFSHFGHIAFILPVPFSFILL